MKKKLVIGLSIAGIAALAIGNSLAYLEDEKTDLNVMTMGKVKIEQLEYERVVEDGKWVSTGEADKYGYTPDKIQEFTQNKPLSPAVFRDGYIKWDDRNGNENASGEGSHQQSWGQIGAPGSNQLFDDSVKNAVDKFVFVENTGQKDAYIRTWMAFEQGSLSTEKFEDVIATNGDADHWEWETAATDVIIDGNKYVIVAATYLGPKSNPTGILAPGAISYPSLLQFYMYPSATNEDVEAIDGNKNGVYDIIVVSQAIQTDGFENAKEALDSGFGEVNEETATELFSDSYVYVKTGEEEKLTNALKAGKAIYVDKDVDLIEPLSENGATNIDAKGATVIMNGQGVVDGVHKYGYLAFATEKGATADIKNLTVTGSGFVEVGHYPTTKIKRPNFYGNYVLENVNIKNFESTLRLANGSNLVAPAFTHYGNATLKNCVMTGAKGVTDGYTQYDVGFVNQTDTIIEGGEYGKVYLWSQAYVTINNAKVGTIDSAAITASNLGMLTIGAGTTVDVINLISSDTYTPALTIEDGATVGAINYKGVSYSQAEWLAR